MAKIATATPRKDTASSRKNGSAQQETEKLAYQFFVERGYKHGHDREDWLRAESVVRNRYSS